MQASVLTPSMFIAHEPHTPSRQERRKVNVVSISFLILIRASRTIGPQSLRSIAKVSTTGFFPSSGFQRYTLNSRIRVAPGGPGTVLPTPIFELAGRVNSAIADPQSSAQHPPLTPALSPQAGRGSRPVKPLAPAGGERGRDPRSGRVRGSLGEGLSALNTP